MMSRWAPLPWLGFKLLPFLPSSPIVQQDAPIPKGGEKLVWTPSKLIERLGKEINNEESVWYWATKHGIPVFCPGITDGAVSGGAQRG